MKSIPAMMLIPPCFTVRMVFSGWWEMLSLNNMYNFSWWPKHSVLVISDQRTLVHVLGVSAACSLVDSRFVFVFFSFSNGFLLVTLPQSPALWSVWLKMVLRRDFSISIVDLCSIRCVCVYVASLIHFLHVQTVSFGGRPFLLFVVFFSFCCNVFNRIPFDFQSLGYFLYPTLIYYVSNLFKETLGLHAACLVMLQTLS